MASKSSRRSNIRIAVMGVTGSGKSTFIKAVNPDCNARIGHDLQSCTSEVASYEFKHGEHDITLIDTPGFNDTFKSETEVLQEIANYLDFTYRNPPHLKLNGIIYLQSILDPKMYGSSLRNLKMFKELCGPQPLKNVILVTTRWGQAEASGQGKVAEGRERQLSGEDHFWGSLVKSGSRVARFTDTQDSALQIVLSLASSKPEVLEIQAELVDQDKRLIDTAAGNLVAEETLRLERKYQADLLQLQREMDEAIALRDDEVKEALKRSEDDFQRKLDQLHRDQDMLRYERRNERRDMKNQIDELRETYLKQLNDRPGAQKLDYDAVVKRLQADNNKLRKEQRKYIQEEIDKMNTKPKKERDWTKLVLRLLPTLGTIVFGLIGISMPAGGFSNLF